MPSKKPSPTTQIRRLKSQLASAEAVRQMACRDLGVAQGHHNDAVRRVGELERENRQLSSIVATLQKAVDRLVDGDHEEADRDSDYPEAY